MLNYNFSLPSEHYHILIDLVRDEIQMYREYLESLEHEQRDVEAAYVHSKIDMLMIIHTAMVNDVETTQ